MGRFASLVSTPEVREAFKTRYNIPARVKIEHYHLGNGIPRGPLVPWSSP